MGMSSLRSALSDRIPSEHIAIAYAAGSGRGQGDAPNLMILDLAKVRVGRGRHGTVEVVQPIVMTDDPGLVGVEGVDASPPPDIYEHLVEFPPAAQIIRNRRAVARVAIRAVAEVEHNPGISVSDHAGIGGEQVIEIATPPNAQHRIARKTPPVHQIA